LLVHARDEFATITGCSRKRRLIADHICRCLGTLVRLFWVLHHPCPVAPANNRGGAAYADQTTLGSQSLQDLIGDSGTRYRPQRLVAGNDRRATRCDELHMHGFGSVRDVDQDAQPIHCGNEFSPPLVDPMKVVPWLAALNWRQFTVREGIEA